MAEHDAARHKILNSELISSPAPAHDSQCPAALRPVPQSGPTPNDQDADAPQPLTLLRARREWPRCCRANEKRDELAALHSITSSARPSSVAGSTGRPTAPAA